MILYIIIKVMYLLLFLRLIANIFLFFKKNRNPFFNFLIQAIIFLSYPLVKPFQKIFLTAFDFSPLLPLAILAYIIEPFLRFFF